MQRPADELADVEERTVDRHWADRGMNPRTVRQARVADRALGIDPAAGRLDDEGDHVEHFLLARKCDRCEHEAAVHLDIDITACNHHHLGHLRVGDQWCQWSEPAYVFGFHGIDGGGAHCLSKMLTASG